MSNTALASRERRILTGALLGLSAFGAALAYLVVPDHKFARGVAFAVVGWLFCFPMYLGVRLESDEYVNLSTLWLVVAFWGPLALTDWVVDSSAPPCVCPLMGVLAGALLWRLTWAGVAVYRRVRGHRGRDGASGANPAVGALPHAGTTAAC